MGPLSGFVLGRGWELYQGVDGAMNYLLMVPAGQLVPSPARLCFLDSG